MVVYNVGDMKRRGSPAIKHGSSDSVTETGAQQGKSSSTATIRRTEGNGQEKSSGRGSAEVSGINNRTAAELGDGKHRHRTVGSTKRDIMQLFSTDRANRTDVERVLNRNIGEMMAQGEIRGDALFSAVSPYINEPVTLSLPVVGDFRLDRSDFEKLYRYLKGEL